jgi:hypothetical protein
MKIRTATAMAMVLLAQAALADASYQATSQITGGTLVDAFKGNMLFAKQTQQMLAPTTTTTMVHGNQKATISKDFIEIVDLDAGTMTHVDTVKKTYSVITFDQLRKMMANMPQQMQQAQAQMQQAKQQMPQGNLQFTYDVQVKDPGVTKEVNGLTAEEHIITLTVHMAVPNATASTAPAPASTSPSSTPTPDSIAYTITTDLWIAPEPSQLKEIRDFDVRMGQKMMQGVDAQAMMAQWKANSAAMSQMLGGQPGAADGMAKMAEELAKLKGVHVLEVTTMGGSANMPAGTATTTASGTSNNTPATNSTGSATGQVAQGTAEGTAQGESGHLGVVGSALSSSIIGGFHRKKQQPAQQTQTQATDTPAPAAGSTSTTQTVTMMETTRQETNFSSDSIPASAFQVPAGYKQVPSPMERMAQ